jgi:hypothetical protein
MKNTIDNLVSRNNVIAGYIQTSEKLLEVQRDEMNKSQNISNALINASAMGFMHTGHEPTACKLMIVIPVQGRDQHLRATLDNLTVQRNSLKNPNDVYIVVSEMSPKASHTDLCKSYGNGAVGYHFCKSVVRSHIGSVDIQFNKSLAMNFAVWNTTVNEDNILFHDVDIIMGHGWLKSVLLQIDSLREKKGANWFCQTIKDRKVEYVNSELTSEIFSGQKSIDDLNDAKHTISSVYPSRFPPGGSVMVPSELFFLTGGFDEFLFKGYSPEDSQFLHACTILAETEVDVLETTARSFHLYHPPTEFSNSDLSLLNLYFKTINDENFRYTFYKYIFIKHHESRLPPGYVNKVAKHHNLPNLWKTVYREKFYDYTDTEIENIQSDLMLRYPAIHDFIETIRGINKLRNPGIFDLLSRS